MEDILRRADKGQAALTEEYIQAGRLLWGVKAQCKTCGEWFEDVLVRDFPGRKRATLREYMTLAKGIDAADDTTKVQLAGLFKHGWGAVLNEIRSLKKRKDKPCQPVQGDTAHGETLNILFGDCKGRLRELPDESVDCVITSVPYFRSVIFPGATTVFGGEPHCPHDWEMRFVQQQHFTREVDVVESGRCRKCGAEKIMLGWEDSVAEYIQHLVQVFQEVKRVLKPTGVVWINIADTVADDGRLQAIPQRLTIAFEDDGWAYWQEAIWHIPNRAPETSTWRFGRDHEELLKFSKQTDHYFNAAAAPQRTVGDRKQGEQDFERSKVFQGTAGYWPRLSRGRKPNGLRNRRTVWSIPIEPLRGEHHCPFPKLLVEPMLLSSCPQGGVCLDPFAGTGTVGLVALAHGRRAILIEANPDYCAIAKRRIETELEPYKAELEKRRKERAAALLTLNSEIIVPGDAPAQVTANTPKEDSKNAEPIRQ